MARLPAAALLVVAACYHPADEATCTVSCATSACPGNMQCGAGALCHPQDVPDCGPALVDAGTQSYKSHLLGLTVSVPNNLPDPLSLTPMIDTSMEGPNGCSWHQSQDDGTMICVIAAQNLHVDVPTTVIGSYPLVLFATQSIVVSAPLDVSSHAPMSSGGPSPSGPGANDTMACQNVGNGIAANNGGGGGGGAGGSFGGRGGDGGSGTASGTTKAIGGAAAQRVAATPTSLRGGCRGGDGGTDSGATPGGGSSGGAVYLFSQGEIQVSSSIDASGAGGSAPPGTSIAAGGGGGGSGGMIVLDAQAPLVLDGSAMLMAAGGGGGGGGQSDGTGMVPTAGKDPIDPQTPAANGAGASGGGGGGAGGNGSERDPTKAAMSGTIGGATTAGGGGGGGGAGEILFYPMPTSIQLGNLNFSPIPH